MSLSGKSALKEKRLEAEEEEARRRKEISESAARQTPEDLNVETAKLYTLPESEVNAILNRDDDNIVEEVESLIQMCLCDEDCTDLEIFQDIHSCLDEYLTVLRCEKLWTPLGEHHDNIMDLFAYLHDAVYDSHEIMDYWNGLTRKETEHLYALYSLMECNSIALGEDFYDDGDNFLRILCKVGSIESIEYFSDLMLVKNIPQRGHMANAIAEIMGYGIRNKMKPFVNKDIVERVLKSCAIVLNDKKAHPESNGWVVNTIIKIGSNSEFSDLIRTLVLEPVRGADSREQIELELSGGFSDVLEVVCKGKARLEMIATGKRKEGDFFYEDASKNILDLFSDNDEEGKLKLLRDEIDIFCRLLSMEFDRNPKCCPASHGQHKIPYSYNQITSQIKGIYSRLDAGERLLSSGDFEKAYDCGCKLKEIVMKKLSFSSSIDAVVKTGQRLRERLITLLVESLIGLKRFDEAVETYLKISVAKIFGLKSESTVIVESFEARCIFNYIVCLKELGNFEEAKKYEDILCTKCQKGKACVEDYDIETFQSRARDLMSSLVIPILSPEEKRQRLFGDVVVAGESSVILNIVEKCSWTQASPPTKETEEKDFGYPVQVVPRIQWALIWVKNNLLIWNYGTNRIIHTLKLESFEALMEPVLVDLGNQILYFFPKTCHGGKICFNIVDLLLLKVGGSSTFHDSKMQFLSHYMGQIMGKEHFLQVMCRALQYDSERVVDSSGKDYWRVAIVRRLNINYPEVAIFHSDVGTCLGPLNFDSPSPYLTVNLRVDSFLFLVPSSSLVITATLASNAEISVWNSLVPTKPCVGTFKKTKGAMAERFLVASPNFVFMGIYNRPDHAFRYSPPPTKREIDEAFDSTEISIWHARDCKRVGTLISDNDIVDLHLTKDSTSNSSLAKYMLFSAHVNGSINIWTFCDPINNNSPDIQVSHVHNFKLQSEFEVGDTRLSVVSKYADMQLLISSNEGLQAIWLNHKVSDLPDFTGQGVISKCWNKVRNCDQCLKFTSPGLLKCSRCKRKYYCNVQCQKKAWPKHKTECNK